MHTWAGAKLRALPSLQAAHPSSAFSQPLHVPPPTFSPYQEQSPLSPNTLDCRGQNGDSGCPGTSWERSGRLGQMRSKIFTPTKPQISQEGLWPLLLVLHLSSHPAIPRAAGVPCFYLPSELFGSEDFRGVGRSSALPKPQQRLGPHATLSHIHSSHRNQAYLTG
jgi:hypothetical protein